MIVPRNRDGSGNPILGAEKEGKKEIATDSPALFVSENPCSL